MRCLLNAPLALAIILIMTGCLSPSREEKPSVKLFSNQAVRAYVTNFGGDGFRLYYVKDDRRVQLDSADVTADPAGWHTIRIEQKGDEIKCSLDGKGLLSAQDKTFSETGGVGLWTKADAVTQFDDLRVKSMD